jgi:hypothetical protein
LSIKSELIGKNLRCLRFEDQLRAMVLEIPNGCAVTPAIPKPESLQAEGASDA